MSEDDIVKSLDDYAAGNAIPIGYEFWVDELGRRRIDRQNRFMLSMVGATLVVALASVCIALVALLR